LLLEAGAEVLVKAAGTKTLNKAPQDSSMAPVSTKERGADILAKGKKVRLEISDTYT